MEGQRVDLINRAGELKRELVAFAMSGRFQAAFRERVMKAFPDGVVTDENEFTNVIEEFLFHHRFTNGELVLERFVATRGDLSEADRALLLGWSDNVEGMFEIDDQYRDDGVIAFNHIDELTYQIRSNMGQRGIERLTRGSIMIGRVVPVGDDWMMSGGSAVVPPDQADRVLTGLPRLLTRHPAAVFRNPEKVAEGRRLQAEQRQAFIDLHGDDMIVVPGPDVRAAVMAVFRHVYEQRGDNSEPWTDPGLQLPAEIATADNVGVSYDARDGLGFYFNFAEAQQAFANPALVVRQRYRHIISGYLREAAVSPVPLRRLAESNPGNASLVFQKLLRKPGFSWSRDGEALLRKHKPQWYAEPPQPRVTPAPHAPAPRFRA
jgi:hypothetical protein